MTVLPLSIFGFRALWSPYFLLAIALGIVLYYLITVKWRDRFEGSEPVTKRQISYFLASMVLLYIVKGSPMDLIGHILFSVHMAQMALLLLVVAPFFIIGIPNWVWERLLTVAIFKKLFMLLTRPIISLLLFTLMFSMYHYPLILDQVKLSLPLHTVFTVTLFISAIFLWWPVVNTVKGQPQLHGLKKIGYVILSALLITPACSLIIFVDVPVYETYSSGEAWLKAMALCVPSSTLAGLSNIGLSGPELFTDMPTLYDQQLGGILMKVIQEIIYIVVIGRIFMSWAKYERENADEITRQDLLKRQKLTMHG
ncbi:cytochrome c oxidase assembly factor CtaG [Mammaliicoccus sciuri]|uniref:cytochrome c oxidase assembly factor CtaG n=1 Tax=Sporosarcina sp. FSL K6-3508 TaxID=2921557 RepID=UPI000999C3ED|nr:cytochrome c oxidase assembly factor CtaG [Sporosarcina newyorkensis]MBY0222938.1 cytochrome c oxidase assembly factor CtaG [Sporosarcina aquimarina]